MGKLYNDVIGESREKLLEAMMLMDEGKFRESAKACFSGSHLALEAMMATWNLKPAGAGCWDLLKTVGQRTPVAVSSRLRNCCRRLDRYHHFYKGLNEEKSREVYVEELAMELINYGKEIIKFAQRNLYREGESHGEP